MTASPSATPTSVELIVDAIENTNAHLSRIHDSLEDMKVEHNQLAKELHDFNEFFSMFVERVGETDDLPWGPGSKRGTLLSLLRTIAHAALRGRDYD
jgi:hypothetical protein